MKRIQVNYEVFYNFNGHQTYKTFASKHEAIDFVNGDFYWDRQRSDVACDFRVFKTIFNAFTDEEISSELIYTNPKAS